MLIAQGASGECEWMTYTSTVPTGTMEVEEYVIVSFDCVLVSLDLKEGRLTVEDLEAVIAERAH